MARISIFIGVGFTLLVGGMALIFQPGTGLAGIVGWCLVGVALASFMGAVLSWKRDMRMASDEGKRDESVHVTSYNQSGGITAQTVHVSEPPPGIKVLNLRENEALGDKFVSTLELQLTGRPGRFGVAVRGEHIERVELLQAGPTTVLTNLRREKTDDGRHFVTCGNPPPGGYEVEMVSAKEESSLEVTPLLE